MPAPPEYQNVFRITKPDSSNGDSKIAKRNRQYVSCMACRARKLKCDRGQPCSSCSKRGDTDAASCSYSNGKTTRSRPTSLSKVGDFKASEAQSRLQKLEEMVTSLMQNNDQSLSHSNYSSSDTATDQSSVPSLGRLQGPPASGHGRLDVHGSETRYHGATHWTTVLENIREIQDILDTEAIEGEKGNSVTSPAIQQDLFLGNTQPPSLQDLCASLPPRAVVDKLLSAYFNAKHNQTPIIHSAKFLREYEAFWSNSSSVSFLWISMLFSALFIGSTVLRATAQDLNTPLLSSETFLAKAGHALVAGKYQDGNPYSVEALLFYSHCKHMQDEDCEKHMWVVMGITARLALRMGYHRDPRNLADISPFEGEMRRRVFFHVEAMDLLLSFQAGLPPIIQEDECDTDAPSNLLDTDFDEDCDSLPPSRPKSDPTPMLYYCEKSRSTKIFRRIIRHALSLKHPSYEETMKLDCELEDGLAAMPSSLRVKPLNSSFTDQTYTILHRLNIELLYLRSSLVLHRKYLTYERKNPAFRYSRQKCLDAAMRITALEAELHFACQPGGQLYNDRWMPSSLILYDFLLAAMVICLELYESRNEPGVNLESRAKQYDAVKQAYEIWMSRRASSREARRASNVLGVMLSKVPRPDIPVATATLPPMQPLDLPVTTNIGLLGLDVPTKDFPFPADFAVPDLDSIDYFNTIFSDADNIDWGFVDQCLIERGNSGGEIMPFEWQI